MHPSLLSKKKKKKKTCTHLGILQWQKHKKKSEEGKAQKIALLSSFLRHSEILKEFSKIIK